MRLNSRYFFSASNNPMTECCVRSTANSTPASAIFGPPAPKNSGGNGIASTSGDCFNALTSSAASKSPLASPAMSMKRVEFTVLIFRGGAVAGSDFNCFATPDFDIRKAVRSNSRQCTLNLPRDFKRHIQRALGRFAADERCPVRAHRFDEMLQLQFERLLLLQRHRLAHDPFAAELAHDGPVLRLQQFFQQRRFLFAFARDAVDETFLSPVIERDVAGHRAGAEDANLAHLFRADAAGGEIGDAAVGKAQPRVGDVLGLAQDGNAD